LFNKQKKAIRQANVEQTLLIPEPENAFRRLNMLLCCISQRFHTQNVVKK